MVMPTSEQRPPLPPFTPETAAQKVRAAEDGWNNRDPKLRWALGPRPIDHPRLSALGL